MLVLETDETHPDTQKETGSFGVVLGELLKKAGDEHKPSLGIETAMQYVVEPEGGAVAAGQAAIAERGHRPPQPPEERRGQHIIVDVHERDRHARAAYSNTSVPMEMVVPVCPAV